MNGPSNTGWARPIKRAKDYSGDTYNGRQDNIPGHFYCSAKTKTYNTGDEPSKQKLQVKLQSGSRKEYSYD